MDGSYASPEAEGLLQRAVQVADAAVRLRRKYFRRQDPELTEEELTALVNEWLWRRNQSEMNIPGFRVRWSAPRRELPPRAARIAAEARWER
ncbi:MAG: hypothetical protein WD557_17880 [Dehalococcoidia bacterium]